MKHFKKIWTSILIILVIISCTDDRDLNFLENVAIPTNLGATYSITQDNTGLVTITPFGDGANTFEIDLGDGSPSVTINSGESTEHTYAEATYNVKVTGFNAVGDSAEVTQQLIVSFLAPQNLVVVIENDAAISKQVNVTANADFAAMYDFYSGETGSTVVSANIGDGISYQYTDAGTYSVRVVAKGGAIETTEYAVDFEVTEILAPVASASTPPTRNSTDVISIFSDAYDDIMGTDFNPNWGQATIYTPFDLAGDAMLQYSNLNYQGIQIGASVDASSMEFLHIDIWTSDATSIDIFPLPDGVVPADERFVTKALVPGEWNSFDIPMTDFTDQGLPVNDLRQFKFVGSGTVFIDNLYFHKAPSSTVYSLIEDFEGVAPSFTVFGDIAATEVIANPDPSGENTTANVAKLTKTAGSQPWAGTFFEIGTPLDLINFSKISVKTWSPKSGAQVKLKIENVDASITHEVDLNTTVMNSWEELIYDFSAAPSADYVRIVIFFDFGNAGDDSLYYYDEINLIDDSGGPAPLIFQDFEGTAPTFTVFGDIAATEVIANPDATGANTTANVAKLTKTAGSQPWAGTFFEVGSPLDFATYSKISVKTWSPKSGAQVKLKLENADASITHEVDLNTSVMDSWEELVYDFSAAPAADYVRIVIFFDFGIAGDDSLYYYDELSLTN